MCQTLAIYAWAVDGDVFPIWGEPHRSSLVLMGPTFLNSGPLPDKPQSACLRIYANAVLKHVVLDCRTDCYHIRTKKDIAIVAKVVIVDSDDRMVTSVGR